jgi:ribosomal RNA assembly protein|tara:strand:+ start:127 stop:651 length:525 start_codon:yes stop_codon:yes gene_type:complete
MEQYQDKIIISKKRVPVLIGEKGASKYAIQHIGKIKLDIDSKTGEVTIGAKSPEQLWLAARVIRAIDSGFPPEIARKLFKQDFDYQIIDLKDFARNKRDIPRIKSRLIGKNGAAKRKLQGSAQVWINIADLEVGIIGESRNIQIAYDAIRLLASGTSHNRAFLFIEEQQRKEGN